MASRLQLWLNRIILERALARWRGNAARVPEMSLRELRGLRAMAQQTRQALDQMALEAGFRLAQPLQGEAMRRHQAGTDWHWRPDPWRGPLPRPGLTVSAGRSDLSEGTTLFHDCRQPEICLRQLSNSGAGDAAPCALRLEVFRFDGSFLSLVLDLPASAAEGLKLRHLIRLEAQIDSDKPRPVYVRLNIKHGPNVEQISRQLELQDGLMSVDFDMAYSGVNEKRIEKLWIDLIFDDPAMSQITLRDLTVSRRPRAAL
ncbi:DUF6478 family protein [Pseudogemmobacter faecipullorum]|uniref:Uncharacterized protein n=1 Tax=Pseudogemmobacter faecipullorum TaxID=2755041 RepID=A0ABS8CGP9_9RHOB|nr:DUF6478 family protein [Pseudogemmobacter faecipullorum]MCB5408548.1 hypothetical protein [Pseudogemmobacter faecipullorum]